MSLQINPDADPRVQVPLRSGHFVTVEALQRVDHGHLARAIGLSQEQFEEDIRRWDAGIGMPYGVLAQPRSTDRSAHETAHGDADDQ